MTLPLWHEEAITKAHDRKAFDCGDAEMNAFLWRYARQSHELGSAKTFLAVDDCNPKKSLASTALLRQRSPMSAYRKFYGAALPVTMCRASGWLVLHAYRPTGAGAWRPTSRRSG